MFGSPLGPAGSGGLGDKEPAVDDQLNPLGFVPITGAHERVHWAASPRWRPHFFMLRYYSADHSRSYPVGDRRQGCLVESGAATA